MTSSLGCKLAVALKWETAELLSYFLVSPAIKQHNEAHHEEHSDDFNEPVSCMMVAAFV